MAGRREEPAPAELRLETDESLFVEWSDGHQSLLRPPRLRRMCPCALCREVRESEVASDVGGEAGVDAGGGAGAGAGGASRDPIVGDPTLSRYRIRKMERVGRYAISLNWGDGHNTGIYSWSVLRELCDCYSCRMERDEA